MAEWRPVVGYETSHLVSDDGRVQSLDRMIVGRWGETRLQSGRMLSLFIDYGGYAKVQLHYAGFRRHYFVHALVAEAFVGPRPEGLQLRHLDGNPANNHPSNLAWGTAKENSEDRKRHGRYDFHGEKNGQAKISAEQVREIRASSEPSSFFVRKYGISQPNISMIRNRKTWASLADVESEG